MAPKWWEKAKMLCLPKKDSSDAFLRVVGISQPTKSEYKEFMMYLDTGCVVSNLVSSDVVQALGIPLPSRQSPSVIGVCLNGEELKSSGKMKLKWRAKGFHKIFMTEFDVVMGQDLPWDIILGAATIREHKILKFAGFGLHVVTKTGDDLSAAQADFQDQVKNCPEHDAEMIKPQSMSMYEERQIVNRTSEGL